MIFSVNFWFQFATSLFKCAYPKMDKLHNFDCVAKCYGKYCKLWSVSFKYTWNVSNRLGQFLYFVSDALPSEDNL